MNSKPKRRFQKIPTSENGWRIPDFGYGTGRTAIRPDDANELVVALNALGRMTITRGGATDKVVFSDYNVAINLREDPNTESLTAAINHPFKIYQTGTWLQFKVMSGYVITTGDPITPSGLETTITTTTNKPRHWIYVDITPSTATIQNTFTTPTWATDKIPIGWVDTTNTTAERAVIYQFTHDNIFNPCL